MKTNKLTELLSSQVLTIDNIKGLHHVNALARNPFKDCMIAIVVQTSESQLYYYVGELELLKDGRKTIVQMTHKLGFTVYSEAVIHFASQVAY